MIRFNLFVFIACLLPLMLNGQTVYESPLGFTLHFDKTWKRLPKEVLIQKMKNVADFLDYKKEIQFDACYQKIGNADMDYPYMLFKNIYASANNDESEIRKVQDIFTNKPGIDHAFQKMTNGKVGVELELGKNYYDPKNKVLIFTYDMNLSIKGNLVLLLAFYFGKNASLVVYSYSYKDEFKYDQKEFLEVIYSIKDTGMKSSMSDYVKQHDIAAKHYNQGLELSSKGSRKEAIESYSRAIEAYPVEDSYAKSEAYYNRGLNRRYLNDLKGAIEDYSRAINLRPGYVKAYHNRGYAKLLLEDYNGAKEDFDLTIKHDNGNTEFTRMALGNRGVAKFGLDLDGCPDLKKAISLGNDKVISIYKELCP